MVAFPVTQHDHLIDQSESPKGGFGKATVKPVQRTPSTQPQVCDRVGGFGDGMKQHPNDLGTQISLGNLLEIGSWYML